MHDVQDVVLSSPALTAAKTAIEPREIIADTDDVLTNVDDKGNESEVLQWEDVIFMLERSLIDIPGSFEFSNIFLKDVNK